MSDLNYKNTNVKPTSVKFTYRNYKKDIQRRHVRPISIEFNSTEHHPKPQWLLRAYCLDREAIRCFAMDEILTQWEEVHE